jgi:hypothetical protein
MMSAVYLNKRKSYPTALQYNGHSLNVSIYLHYMFRNSFQSKQYFYDTAEQCQPLRLAVRCAYNYD